MADSVTVTVTVGEPVAAPHGTPQGKPPVTSHAVTGYSVIEAWSKAVEKAGTFDTDKVRDVLQTFKDEKLLAGPTTFTDKEHINMQRDLLLIEVKDGKSGNIIQVFKAAQMPK